MQHLNIAINNRYERCFSMYGINLKLNYEEPKTVKIVFSHFQLHSASSMQIPHSTNRYNFMLPSVYVSPLKLHLATKINLHGVSDSVLFRIHLKVRLSPLKSSVLRNSRS